MENQAENTSAQREIEALAHQDQLEDEIRARIQDSEEDSFSQ